MGTILFRLATRFNWRVAATVMGIAVCAMYSSGAMVLLDGLEGGASSVLSRIETGPFFAYNGEDGMGEFTPPGDLQGNVTLGKIHDATLHAANLTFPARAFSLSDSSLLALSQPDPGTALFSSYLMAQLNLTTGKVVTMEGGEGVSSLVVGVQLRPSIRLPDEWFLLSDEDFSGVFPQSSGLYNFVLVEERPAAEQLEGDGFTVIPLTSAGDFFLEGLEEARRVVLALVVVSSVAITVLAFSLVTLEVRYREREIGTLRALGMAGRDFAKLYGLQLAFIVSAGSFLGIALGVVVANGLVSFAPFFGLSTVIRPQVTAFGLMLPFLSSLAAGLIGGTATILSNLRRFAREA